jgi:hypothetical protein
MHRALVSGVSPLTDRTRRIETAEKRSKAQEEVAMMLIPVLLGAHLTIAVADPVPTFNVEPSCRQAASGDIGIKQDLSVCLDDEKGAREQLVKEWGQFAPTDRSLCARLSGTGGAPTYTELLVCLEMARDARKLPKEKTLGIGQ